MPTLTMKQVDRALDHLRREYPGFMSSSERDDYLDALSHLRPGELPKALQKLPIDRRPDPDVLLHTVMEARPAMEPGPKTTGGKTAKPDPAFVHGVIDQARRELNRVRDAV